MKLTNAAVLLIALLAIGSPAPAYPIYTGGDDGQHLYNGVYNDWTYIANPYVVFDMGSPVPISSVSIHERTGGGLVHNLQMLFSNDGYYGFASASYFMDNSCVSHPATLWAVATFEPITARYCRVFVDSTGTYIQADEIAINGRDGAGNPIPEPSSLLAFGAGIAVLIARRRRRQ